MREKNLTPTDWFSISKNSIPEGKHKFTIIGPEGKKEYWSEQPIPEIVEEQNRYKDCTREELENLLLMAQRLEENDGISMTETIIKVEEVLEEKIDSGIIYDSGSEGFDLTEQKKG